MRKERERDWDKQGNCGGFWVDARAEAYATKKRYEERERGLAKQIEVAGFWLGAQAGMPVLPKGRSSLRERELVTT